MALEPSQKIAFLKSIHLFRGLKDEELATLAEAFHTLQAKAQEMIFNQNDPDHRLFFIFRGEVRLTCFSEELQDQKSLGILSQGDYFGQEALEEDLCRLTSAMAATDAILLYLDCRRLEALFEQFETLPPRFDLVFSSFELSQKTTLPWLTPGEAVYYIAQKHRLFLLISLLPPVLLGLITILPLLYFYFLAGVALDTLLILAGISALVCIAWSIWNYVDWSNDYYILTKRRLIFQEKVVLLYDSRQETPLHAIQSVGIATTLFGRWFRYGNISIRSYTGTILFDRIGLPDQVQAMIQEQQNRARVIQDQDRLQNLEQRIARSTGLGAARSDGPAPTGQPEKPQASSVKPGSVQAHLADLFHLRIELNGVITFRTHWFILLKTTFLPGLLMVLGLAALVARLMAVYDVLSVEATLALFFVVELIFGGWWFYTYMDWHNDIYQITQDMVVDINKKPLAREEKRSAPIKNILSVEYQRLGLLGLIFNFGTVFIRIGETLFTFDYVFNPSEVQRDLFARMDQLRYKEKLASEEQGRQQIIESISAYHRLSRPPQPPENQQ